MHTANATLDRSGNLRSRINIDTTPRTLLAVTTHCDEENQAFLATDCDCLQGPFTSLQSLSVNGSSNVALRETIRSQRFVLQHKIANAP